MDERQLSICLDIIEENEGFVPYVYKDTKGIDTIGYGRNLKTYPLTDDELKNHCYKNGKDQLCIFKDYAKELVKKEILDIHKKLLKYHWYECTQKIYYRRAAIIDIVYNMGLNTFLKYKNTIKLLDECKYDEASEELLKGTGANGKSKYYEQVGNRALRNSMMIRDNKYYTK